MKYVLLFVLALPSMGNAQSKVAGFGSYFIGITTPNSLDRIELKEEEQSYVKGTIALPCTHIRTFTAATVTIDRISVANVVLVFYDNTLFKISCDYSDSLRAAFLEQHGPGVRQPVRSVQFCTKEKDKFLLMWGESWLGADILVLVFHRRGYTADCKREESARLLIVSQPMAALSSECDLKPADPFLEEFIEAQMSNQGKQR